MSLSMPALKEQARCLLLARELTNASVLWVLEHEEVAEVLFDDEAKPTAAALLVCPRAGDWQKPRFPELRRLWLEAQHPQSAEDLLRRLPRGERFYVRIHRRWLRESFGRRYLLEPGYELLYFRGDGRAFRPRSHCEVVLQQEPTPPVLSLMEGTGRTREASIRLARRCGGVYVARLARVPVGVCCANDKTEHVSEILAVLVREEARRQGVGQSLVSVATQDILARRRIPTYCTRDNNLASQALVRALGFEEYQRVLYAVASPQVPTRG